MALIPKENLVKASNMMLVSAGLSALTLVYYLYQPVRVSMPQGITTIALMLVLAVCVRAGLEWARYLFVILVIIGAILSPLIAYRSSYNVLTFSIYIGQIILHLYAAVLMFKGRDSEY